MHINSTVALAPPVVILDDSGTYHSSRTQRWLWSCWLDFWALVNRDAGGYRKVVVINGDLGELDRKERSAQVITVNKSTILQTVRDVLEPAIWDALYIVRGTSAHEGKSAWLEEAIAADMVKCIPSAENIFSWWQIRAEVAGVRFDIAHHAPMGNTPWFQVNSAVKLAAVTLWHYAVERGIKPPDEVIRSHNHRYAEATVEDCHATFLPCWSGTTEFGYRSGMENTLPNIGGVVYFCENGQRQVKHYKYVPEKERKIWAMKL